VTPAQAYHSCSVDIYPQDLGNSSTTPGWTAGYRLECNFRISGYAVTIPGQWRGIPRDTDGYPTHHAPTFNCHTWYGGPASGTPSNEFTCHHYSSYYGPPDWAIGHWEATWGWPVCSAPLSMTFTVTDAGGGGYAWQSGPRAINCGSAGGNTGPPAVSPSPTCFDHVHRRVHKRLRRHRHRNGRIHRHVRYHRVNGRKHVHRRIHKHCTS
jgi:hypothetical protein